jgi:4-amino-4-deoxy-L-arabinose transferase-like glycosyltransferase
MSFPLRPLTLWTLIAVSLALMPLIWIGDVSFIMDEPLLIEKALRANAEGQLETLGLEGTRGFHYGPLPTWIYQALLALTHDLVSVAALRCLLANGVIALSLVWLAHTLVLPLAFGALLLLSPYLWFYARFLWDNTFLLPLSALLLASTFAFLREPRTWKLVLACACLLALPLVHLMSAAIVAPVALYLVATRPAALLRAWLPLSVLLAVVVAGSWAYLRHLASASLHSGGGTPLALEAVTFAWQGARFFSATGLDYFLGELWSERLLFSGARWLVLASGVIAHGLFALGVLQAVRGLLPGTVSHAQGLRRTAGGLLLAIVLTQTVVNAASATSHHPHYYNATWIAVALLSWLGAARLWRYPAARIALSAQGAMLSVTIAAIAGHIHAHGGDQRSYGPTLANQLTVAREIAAHAPREVRFTGAYLRRFPFGPRAAMLAEGYEPSAAGPVMIVQPASDDPDHGQIRVATEQPVARPGL